MTNLAYLQTLSKVQSLLLYVVLAFCCAGYYNWVLQKHNRGVCGKFVPRQLGPISPTQLAPNL